MGLGSGLPVKARVLSLLKGSGSILSSNYINLKVKTGQ